MITCWEITLYLAPPPPPRTSFSGPATALEKKKKKKKKKKKERERKKERKKEKKKKKKRKIKRKIKKQNLSDSRGSNRDRLHFNQVFILPLVQTSTNSSPHMLSFFQLL